MARKIFYGILVVLLGIFLVPGSQLVPQKDDCCSPQKAHACCKTKKPDVGHTSHHSKGAPCKSCLCAASAVPAIALSPAEAEILPAVHFDTADTAIPLHRNSLWENLSNSSWKPPKIG